MKFIDNLERKIGKYAIKNLMLYLIIMYAVGFFLLQFKPEFYYEYLSLDVEKILGGEVWRLITYLCYSPDESILFFLLHTVLYFALGRTLENILGSFRFNLYIFVGFLGVDIAAFIIYFAFGQLWTLTASQIYTSMFLAIAACFPEMEFRLYFPIPIKAKWLDLIYGCLILYRIIVALVNGIGALSTYGIELAGFYFSRAIEIVLSLLNFIIFFFIIRKPVQGAKQTARKVVYKMKVEKAKAASNAGTGTRHKCCVCGITEKDDPYMEFRYCSQCDGAREYCSDHLYTHVHVYSETKS